VEMRGWKDAGDWVGDGRRLGEVELGEDLGG